MAKSEALDCDCCREAHLCLPHRLAESRETEFTCDCVPFTIPLSGGTCRFPTGIEGAEPLRHVAHASQESQLHILKALWRRTFFTLPWGSFIMVSQERPTPWTWTPLVSYSSHDTLHATRNYLKWKVFIFSPSRSGDDNSHTDCSKVQMRWNIWRSGCPLFSMRLEQDLEFWTNFSDPLFCVDLQCKCRYRLILHTKSFSERHHLLYHYL